MPECKTPLLDFEVAEFFNADVRKALDKAQLEKYLRDTDDIGKCPIQTCSYAGFASSLKSQKSLMCEVCGECWTVEGSNQPSWRDNFRSWREDKMSKLWKAFFCMACPAAMSALRRTKVANTWNASSAAMSSVGYAEAPGEYTENQYVLDMGLGMTPCCLQVLPLHSAADPLADAVDCFAEPVAQSALLPHIVCKHSSVQQDQAVLHAENPCGLAKSHFPIAIDSESRDTWGARVPDVLLERLHLHSADRRTSVLSAEQGERA
eukprot:CAMPEP_0204905412 /NCGR_PEP_ID=MMETSP1397-20131031/5406_1 /ASSEMBLY_ACC=CAM_ASM_000891 /TAXON_ID=49980 /ORGANISM="Climacostomum Climacostomum virens, Strain Stock W-24" /LENGTH=262 /DNA_ID=CAMNT_0052074287 /DNA_START=226 /DNA_END=1016 /DNA_ORIENTATION=+